MQQVTVHEYKEEIERLKKEAERQSMIGCKIVILHRICEVQEKIMMLQRREALRK